MQRLSQRNRHVSITKKAKPGSRLQNNRLHRVALRIKASLRKFLVFDEEEIRYTIRYGRKTAHGYCSLGKRIQISGI